GQTGSAVTAARIHSRPSEQTATRPSPSVRSMSSGFTGRGLATDDGGPSPCPLRRPHILGQSLNQPLRPKRSSKPNPSPFLHIPGQFCKFGDRIAKKGTELDKAGPGWINGDIFGD